MNDPRPLLLTVKQCAALLSLSESTVSKLIRRGELLSITIGRSRRVSLVALQSWIDAREREVLEATGQAPIIPRFAVPPAPRPGSGRRGPRRNRYNAQKGGE